MNAFRDRGNLFFFVTLNRVPNLFQDRFSVSFFLSVIPECFYRESKNPFVLRLPQDERTSITPADHM